jgi:hypothetical protein
MSAKDIAPYKGKRKALLLTLADPENIGLDVLAICAKAGLSRESYYKYTKDPIFQNALKELSINIYVRHLPQSVNRVIKKAKSGDMGANRLMHESTGMISKGTNQSVNVAVHDTPPATMRIDTPEQLEQAIAHCQAELGTLKSLMTNLCAMRTSPQGRIAGDGIHPPTDAPPHGEG